MKEHIDLFSLFLKLNGSTAMFAGEHQITPVSFLKMPLNSSTDLINKIQLLSQYINISFGFFLLFLGVIGNCLAMLTFLSFGHYKTNPISFYMLVKVVSDMIGILLGLTTRILTEGFQIDWTSLGRIWCKLRRYLVTTDNTISSCLFAVQSIDIFLCSSPCVSRRQISSIKTAHRMTIAIIIFSILHSLPFLFYQNIVVLSTSDIVCTTTNTAYNQYQLYILNIGIYVVFPVLFVCIFGMLTYRNFHKSYLRHQRRILNGFIRQMILMYACNAIILIIFDTPYGVIQLYLLLVNHWTRSNVQLAIEQLLNRFSTICFYGPYAVS